MLTKNALYNMSEKKVWYSVIFKYIIIIIEIRIQHILFCGGAVSHVFDKLDETLCAKLIYPLHHVDHDSTRE